MLSRHLRPLEFRVLNPDCYDGRNPGPDTIRRYVARGRALHGAALRGAAGRWLARWRRAALARETARELTRLDDHLLADIGLTRDGIGALAHALAHDQADGHCKPAAANATVVRLECSRGPNAPCDDGTRRAA